MTLQACPECQKPVSSDAAACPHCGAKVATPPAPPAPPGAMGTMGWFFGGLILVFIIWAGIKGATTNDGRDEAREAIKLCWSEQGRKSLDPATARFVASTCEMMEREFQKKYGVSP